MNPQINCNKTMINCNSFFACRATSVVVREWRGHFALSGGGHQAGVRRVVVAMFLPAGLPSAPPNRAEHLQLTRFALEVGHVLGTYQVFPNGEATDNTELCHDGAKEHARSVSCVPAALPSPRLRMGTTSVEWFCLMFGASDREGVWLWSSFQDVVTTGGTRGWLLWLMGLWTACTSLTVACTVWDHHSQRMEIWSRSLGKLFRGWWNSRVCIADVMALTNSTDVKVNMLYKHSCTPFSSLATSICLQRVDWQETNSTELKTWMLVSCQNSANSRIATPGSPTMSRHVSGWTLDKKHSGSLQPVWARHSASALPCNLIGFWIHVHE